MQYILGLNFIGLSSFARLLPSSLPLTTDGAASGLAEASGMTALHCHWHTLSKMSGHSLTSRAQLNDDGGNRHPSDYVVDLLKKINEGS